MTKKCARCGREFTPKIGIWEINVCDECGEKIAKDFDKRFAAKARALAKSLKKCCEEAGVCLEDPSACLRCPHYFSFDKCKKNTCMPWR